MFNNEFSRERNAVLKEKRMNTIKSCIIKLIPAPILQKLRKAVSNPNVMPLPGKINMGDFNRTTPFSKEFGYDRGGPVDRYYIENFLQEQADVIQGRVLEIGDKEYTLCFGACKVTQSDILSADEKIPNATYI